MTEQPKCHRLDAINAEPKKEKPRRKPAVIQCPFCDFVAESWFLRERLDQLGWHIQNKHPELAICRICNRRQDLAPHLSHGCSTDLGVTPYKNYDYRAIISAWHAHALGINPKKETAK